MIQDIRGVIECYPAQADEHIKRLYGEGYTVFDVKFAGPTVEGYFKCLIVWGRFVS